MWNWLKRMLHRKPNVTRTVIDTPEKASMILREHYNLLGGAASDMSFDGFAKEAAPLMGFGNRVTLPEPGSRITGSQMQSCNSLSTELTDTILDRQLEGTKKVSSMLRNRGKQ